MKKETLHRLIEEVIQEWESSPEKKFRDGYGPYWEPAKEYVAMLERARKYYKWEELHPGFIIGAWHGEFLKGASRSSIESYGEIQNITIDEEFLKQYEEGRDLGISLGAEKYAN